MALLPNNESSKLLTDTQFIHEWVHHLEAEGWKMADGGRGKASYPADQDAVKAMLDEITTLSSQNSKTMPYGSSITGEPDFRQQAAKGISREYGIEYKKEEIMFTTGGQFGLAASFHLLEKLTPGGVIITPKPWYVNHAELSGMFSSNQFSEIANNNKFVAIDLLDNDEHKITAKNLENAISLATKPISGFLFCNPGNPLGNVMLKKDWLSIAEILRKHPNIPIMLDEAFAEIVFDDDDFQISLLHAAPDLKERTILFRSGTKALGLAGERLALLVAPYHFIKELIPLQSRLTGNPPLSAQAGMAAAMENMTIAKKKTLSDYYKANCDFLFNKLEPFGVLSLYKKPPKGCFYFLADLSCLKGQKIPQNAMKVLEKENDIIENDIDIVMSLMFGFGQPKEKQGVALIPASSFGIDKEKCLVRVSFSSYREEIENIANMITNAVSACQS